MPSASEFSITPDANLTIGGINVAEGCSPAGINGAVRYLAAAARDSYNQLTPSGTYLPLSGGVLTGNLTRSTRGAFLHHANSAQVDGKIYNLPEGSPRPAAAEGVMVFYYT